MTEPIRPAKAQPKSAADGKPIPVTTPAADEPVSPAKPLTPEEQMALYEKHLKENDWGHQPC